MHTDLAAKNGWGAGGGAGSPELCSRGGVAPEKTELGLPETDSSGAGVDPHRRREIAAEELSHLRAAQSRGTNGVLWLWIRR